MFTSGTTPNTFSNPLTILPPKVCGSARVEIDNLIPFCSAASARAFVSGLPKPSHPFMPLKVVFRIGANDVPAKLK